MHVHSLGGCRGASYMGSCVNSRRINSQTKGCMYIMPQIHTRKTAVCRDGSYCSFFLNCLYGDLGTCNLESANVSIWRCNRHRAAHKTGAASPEFRPGYFPTSLHSDPAVANRGGLDITESYKATLLRQVIYHTLSWGQSTILFTSPTSRNRN